MARPLGAVFNTILMKLNNCYQTYSWGTIGNSTISCILDSQKQPYDKEKALSEYWMGTHPNGPSMLSDVSLSEYLQTNHSLTELPFLLKVLSVSLPLSIQVHPDKETAEELFKSNPSIYKDANDKPELFICISNSFELLFGFIELNELIETVSFFKEAFLEISFEETQNLLENPSSESYFQFYKSLLRISDEEMKTLIRNVIALKSGFSREFVIDLITTHFGEDQGVVFALFMNYLSVSKGQSLFIGAGVPHAYLKGECIECMVNSDNTVRLGCTPKLVDKETYLKIIDKIGDKLVEVKGEFLGEKAGNRTVYQGDYRFSVAKLSVDGKEIIKEGYSILFILEGEGTLNGKEVVQFESYYLEKDQYFELEGKIEAYLAYSN